LGKSRNGQVDTHVHLAAGMTAAHMLDFVKRTIAERGDDIVERREVADGETGEIRTEAQTLRQVFERLDMGANISVNDLDVDAGEAFMRFDIFNRKYNIFGHSELRTLFLKTGVFFACFAPVFLIFF
jgi:AMP deaminase